MINKFEKQEANRSYQDPDDELFSNGDICHFSNYFFGFAIGYLISTKHIPEPFVKGSEASALIFGYKDGEYFIEECIDGNEYDARLTELQNQLDAKSRSDLQTQLIANSE